MVKKNDYDMSNLFKLFKIRKSFFYLLLLLLVLLTPYVAHAQIERFTGDWYHPVSDADLGPLKYVFRVSVSNEKDIQIRRKTVKADSGEAIYYYESETVTSIDDNSFVFEELYGNGRHFRYVAGHKWDYYISYFIYRFELIDENTARITRFSQKDVSYKNGHIVNTEYIPSDHQYSDLYYRDDGW